MTATSVVTLLLLAFDRWLWRYPPFRWAVRRPVLHGTWKMAQRTTYEPRAHETMESYLVIHQTYSTIRVNGLYAISDSESLSADLAIEKGRCVLSYIFRTDAHTMHRTGNPPSRGAATLKVGRQPQLHLEGDYWMERERAGASSQWRTHRRPTTPSRRRVKRPTSRTAWRTDSLPILLEMARWPKERNHRAHRRIPRTDGVEKAIKALGLAHLDR